MLLGLAIATAPSIAHAQDPDLAEIRDLITDLHKKMSPAEQKLLKRVEALERSHQAPWWERNWIAPTLSALVALLLAAGGWYYKSKELKRQLRESMETLRHSKWEILVKSLELFSGRTQRRSIGIAMVQTYWKHHPELHTAWVEILSTQAAHLIARSRSVDSVPEHTNLARIMEIIVDRRSELGSVAKDELVRVLKDGRQGERGLRGVEKEHRDYWLKRLCGEDAGSLPNWSLPGNDSRGSGEPDTPDDGPAESRRAGEDLE